MTNDIFIGRQQEQERLWRDVFGLPAESNGSCYSLIGPNNIGKTTLIRRMAEKFIENPIPNVYYVSTTLKDATSEWMFLIMLVCKLKKLIPEEMLNAAPMPDEFYIADIMEAYEFYSNRENWGDTDSDTFVIVATTCWNQLFAGYSAIGIRLIISIDEFDFAKKLCKKGMLFGKLFGLSPKSNESLGHSVILISRRSVSNIEHDMEGGSTLASGYQTLLLKGFNNDEIEEYFRSYADLPCGIPNVDSKQQILYYCGRNPGLLMIMRHEAELLLDRSALSIRDLYIRNRADIENAYDRMSELMKDERTSPKMDVQCFDVFLEAFIGPVSSEPEVFQAGLEGLENHGFALQSPSGSDIYTLSGMDDSGETNGPVYEPLSPYFVQYITDRFLPSEMENLSKLLVGTEVMLRDAIDEIGQYLYSDAWDETIDNSLPPERQAQRQNFYRRLEYTSVANNAAARGIRSSLLNVLNFKDYYELCLQNWTHMGGFYRDFKTNEAILHAIDCLYEARNLHSHKNFKILDRAHCVELRGICNQMISGVEQTLTEFRRDPNSIAQSNFEMEATSNEDLSVVESTDTPTIDIPDSDTMNQYVGETVSMHAQRVGIKGNLSGIVSMNGKVYRVSIPREVFKVRNVSAADYCNTIVEVTIVRWDSNKASPHFVADLPGTDDYRVSYNETQQITDPEQAMVGCIVTLSPRSVGTTGNLVGLITANGVNYKASISHKTLSLLGMNAYNLMAEPFAVKIVRWDTNPANKHFNVEPVH